VRILQSDIEFERGKSASVTVCKFSDAYLETLAVYRKIVERLLDYDVLLFHGSAVAVDGQAYLFAATSGTGKTTHTNLWTKNIPKAYVVNGDKPLLKINDDGVTVYGTPWQGKENYGRNISVPLKAVCQLERSDTNHIEPITIKESLPMLFQQSYRPNDIDSMNKTIELINKLGMNTKLYRLGCNMQDEAAFVAYEGMR
jgi:hypothetical protein